MNIATLLLIALWLTIALAALNVAFQAVDLHTTSELLKHGYGREANPRLAKYLNDPARPEDYKFWLLVAVKLACVAAVVTPAVIARYLPDVYTPAFTAMEVALTWEYGKQMWLNWSLYLAMTGRIGD
jgi:hypothetical protein